jgi:pyridoxine 5-phosphate synthase
MGGADGIVFHLREDRRHINERDVHILKQTVRGKLDFELATVPEIVNLCCQVKPHLATLVPEKREEVTTEGGLDVIRNQSRLQDVTSQLREHGIQVAFFVDPDLAQIDATRNVGAECIELHTGDFANAKTVKEQLHQAKLLAAAAEHAHSIGLRIHAGHGLDYNNYLLFKSHVPHLSEVSIGFAVVARALFIGMEQAVRDLCRLVKA